MVDWCTKFIRQQVSSAPEMMAEIEHSERALIHIMVGIAKEKHVMEDMISHKTFNVTFSEQCVANRRALRRKPTSDGYYSVFDMPTLFPKPGACVTLTGVRKGAGLEVKEWHPCEQAEQHYWILRNTRDKLIHRQLEEKRAAQNLQVAAQQVVPEWGASGAESPSGDLEYHSATGSQRDEEILDFSTPTGSDGDH